MKTPTKRLFLLAASLLVAACATVQQTENVGPNDPAALAAIRAAYMKVAEQRSFRARMVTESDGKVHESMMEYAAPGRMHMVMKTENMEHIVIDGVHYMKSDGKWTRLPIASAAWIEQVRKDPETLAALERTVSGAQRVGPDAVNGHPAIAYRYYQAAKVAGGLASSTGWVKFWIGANGLPLKVESDSNASVLGFGSHGKTTVYYQDYGANIRITAPI
jgi:hypothetical protein